MEKELIQQHLENIKVIEKMMKCMVMENKKTTTVNILMVHGKRVFNKEEKLV